jgi:hypothetical protein
VCRIPLSRGLFATVDAADYGWLSQWRWSALASGRQGCGPIFSAVRSVSENGKQRTVLMRREIMRPEQGEVVDHINGDSLDYRRSNLRTCSQAQNCLNRVAKRTCKTSRFKGVWWHRKNKKWVADFWGRYIGSFKLEEEAAQAYDDAARLHDPEYALLNFPEEGVPEAERRELLHRGAPRQTTSKHFGVTFNERQQKWVVQIGGRHVGIFREEGAAAEAAAAARAGV